MEINVKLVNRVFNVVYEFSVKFIERKNFKFVVCSSNEWDLLRYKEESGED